MAFLPGVEITSSWGGKPAQVLWFFPNGPLPALETTGLNGVEVFHPAHTRDREQEYARIADRLGLVKTGGSDMHIPSPEPQKMVGGTYCDWDEVLQYLQR